ncbi:MAG: hypothetical protein GVY36_14620 [Verrucomicrobia bacterium]|jgi:hypothetical protein|nr:hypothetical protein [Verrucomicrobiota bacterium]
MARAQRKEITVFSLSFMDCICCGFGAIILLLTLNRGIMPYVIEEDIEDQEEILEVREEQIYEIFGQVAALELELVGVKEQVAEAEAALAAKRKKRSNVRGEFANVPDYAALIEKKNELLKSAMQERDKLRNTPPPWRTDSVGGIPADSRFVIFVIDTSGSIADRAGVVIKVLREVLELYPKVEGIQVVNDEGVYLAGSPGQWIRGDLKGRQLIYDAVGHALNLSKNQPRNYGQLFAQIMSGGAPNRIPSNSDPANGMMRALRDFGGGEDISMYVLGDDGPSRGTAAQIIDLFDRLNARRADGTRPMRVHSIGILTPSGNKQQFSAGMRYITNRYDGAFVGMTW